MKPGRMIALTGLCGSVLTIGCASTGKERGFEDVQDAVSKRVGVEVHWTRTGGSTEVASRVRALLDKELHAEDAVEIALLNSRRLQAAFQDLGIARAEMDQARLPGNPLLDAEIRLPGRPYEIILVQDLISLLQLPSRRRLAAAAFERSKLQVGGEVLVLAAEVRRDFYELQAAAQTVAMRRAIVETARLGAEIALGAHEAGNITDLDLESEQAMLEEAKVDLAQSEMALLERRERMNGLLGLWGDQTAWRVTARLPDLPPGEGETVDVESVAVARRLDLAAARQEVEVARRQLPLARLSALGETTVGVHQEREPEGRETTGPAVSLPLPLFDRGRAARARAEAVLAKAQEDYAALAIEIRSQARMARQRVSMARDRVVYYRDVILPRRRRILEQTQLEFNAMLIGVFQLLRARQDEIDAHERHIEALRDYWTARANVDFVTSGGGPIEERQPSHRDGGEGR